MIAIIVIALLQIVPAIFAFVADDLVPEIESSFGNAPAPEYDSDYSDDYDTDDDSDYAYDTLYDVFGDNGITCRRLTTSIRFRLPAMAAAMS